MGQTANGYNDGKGTGIYQGGATGESLNSPGIRTFHTAGAPVNGGAGTFANAAPKLSILIRDDTGVLHCNVGTLASPTWQIITNTP
jgi:hypothetical protein